MSRVEARIAPMIGRMVWGGLLIHGGFFLLFVGLGVSALAVANAVAVALWALGAVLNGRGRQNLAMWLLVVVTAGHAALAVLIVGWSSGFQYYLIPLIPLVMFNERLRATRALAAGFVVIASFLWLGAEAPAGSLPASAAGPLQYFNSAVPLISLGLLSFQFRVSSMNVEQRVAAMASTDALTGLANRRHMLQRLREEESRSARTRSTFSVILIDIDHFKRVNDTCGHDVGDRVLQDLAELARNTLRAQDIVARWGGEEFLVLLPDTEQNGAADVAERLRVAVENALGRAAPEVAPVTITLGVAVYQESVTGCLKSADDALYRGKEHGRNRVVVAGSEPGSEASA